MAKYSKIWAIVALMGFGISSIVHGATYWGIDLHSTYPLLRALRILIFPLQGILMVSIIQVEQDNLRQRGSAINLTAISRPILILLIGIAVALLVSMSLAGSGDGTPAIQDGKYIMHSHGAVLRELTAVEYQWEQLYVLRGFSGSEAFFYLGHGVLFWCLEE